MIKDDYSAVSVAEAKKDSNICERVSNNEQEVGAILDKILNYINFRKYS
ncbi:MAG: hypothetical protein QXY62_04555 [Candidatus Altiarchaeota archaeon]